MSKWRHEEKYYITYVRNIVKQVKTVYLMLIIYPLYL